MMKNILGTLYGVSLGPGAHEHMTFRARQAIEEADVVIGYSTYIKLVKDLLDGKEVIKKGMTEELDRSSKAYEHAKQGKTVALVSSGDIGVYGMAGLTYELLLESDWTPDDPIQVEVVSDTTALSSCASLVGALLTHDFCSISLSDLLTPWPVIARRLESAASGDFVVALYNPKSGRRTQHSVEAQNILLRHRSPDTPVAIVKSGYRSLQNIQMVRLAEMADCDIGMLTTVLIGNSSSFCRENLLITPRGYRNKYQEDGRTLDGEQSGRSLSMGLEGWKQQVRHYVQNHPDMNLPAVARHFEMPLGEILSAISAADQDSPAGCYSAQPVAADVEQLLRQCSDWPRLRVIVRSAGGAIAELLVGSGDFQRRGDWLNLENDSLHLHVDLSKVAQAYCVQKHGEDWGVFLLDSHGEPVLYWLKAESKNA